MASKKTEEQKPKVSDGMEKIVALCKRRGFVFPSSEIYGGFANAWDYGPLGAELKKNIKDLWWQRFVRRRDDMVGIDAALIMNPKVWEASGHVATFSDPLVECKKCHSRFRADQLINKPEAYQAVSDEYALKVKKLFELIGKKVDAAGDRLNKIEYLREQEGLTKEQAEKFFDAVKPILDKIRSDIEVSKKALAIGEYIKKELAKAPKFVGFITQIFLNRYSECPNCDAMQWEEPKQFNLMLKTFIGPAEEAANIAYFRPETAQAMFVDFKNVLQTSRKKLPFGIAQIGKAFRNEITPGNFIFRTREFEQMEIEYFIPKPAKDREWEEYFEMWRKEMMDWMAEIGLDLDKVHELEVPKEELAHYSKRTIDFEYDFPFGKKELYGLAYRTDFDLANHMKNSGEDLNYTEEGKEPFIPHVIEPTWGVDRSVLAVLCNSFDDSDPERTVLKLPYKLAPYKAAVFPLLKNKPELVEKAKAIFDELKQDFMVAWDDRGNVGKRYYSQDEIGTPFCITVDFQTVEDGTVTIRHRDSAKQERIESKKLSEFLSAQSRA